MDLPANEAVVSFQERIGEMCRACMSLKCDSTYSLYIDDMRKLFTDCTSIQSDHTLVTVQQTSVPSAEYDATKKNWEHYYFESMKRTFGFGVFL